MKHLGIFSDSTAVQNAINSNELVKPYIVLTGQSGSRLVDYNTLIKSPIVLGTSGHPLEAYEDRYTYYYKASYTLNENYGIVYNENASIGSTYTLNKTTNQLYDDCAYNGTGNGEWYYTYLAGLGLSNDSDSWFNPMNIYISYASSDDSEIPYYSVILSNNNAGDTESQPIVSIDPVIHQ